jgi:aromatic ring-cleaving dioxygenase
MSKELNLEIDNLTSTWKLQTRCAAIVEMASVLSESHGSCDVCTYEVRKGKLYSPTHKQYVEDVTQGVKDKRLVSQLQSWVNNNTNGLAVWISPPLAPDKPSTKIATFEIWTGRNLKFVKNKFNKVDLTEEEILGFANLLYTYSIDPVLGISTSEELRDKLIIIKDKNEVLDLIQQKFPDFNDRQSYKKHVLKSTELYEDSQKQPTTFKKRLKKSLGKQSLTCLTIGATTQEFNLGIRTLRCTCKFCHARVDAQIYAGRIHCPACGRSRIYHC